MRDDDLRETQERYRTRYREFGYDPRTLGWTKGRQRVRFQAALEGLRREDYGSVLDVGCGFGDFHSFLQDHGWKGVYYGVDVVPDLIQEGQRRHAGLGGTLECRDITREPPNKRMDLALALGVFNHRLHQDNLEFVREILATMWEASRQVVVLDFLSAVADSPRQDLFYAQPGEVFELARHFSRRVMIHHAYMPFEFQVKIWHDQAFTVEVPAFAPYLTLVTAPNGLTRTRNRDS